MKNIQTVEKYLQHNIDLLEGELDNVEGEEEYWTNIWSTVSDELKTLNAPKENDPYPPPPPSMMFFDLYCKVKDIQELADIIDAFSDRKWEQREKNNEKIEKWIMSGSIGYFQFEVDVVNLDDNLDREYLWAIDTIQKKIQNNNIIVEIDE